MNFYEDDSKITFDRAEVLVERYIREYSHRMSRVTSKDVARKYDVDDSNHNLIRLNSALDERLATVRPSGPRVALYRLEDEDVTG